MVWYLTAGGLALIGLGIVAARLVVRRRRRPPRTRDEKLAAAQAAARAMRRGARRPGRDIFERGHGIRDRHSAAVAENAVYGDAADAGSGGGQY